MSIQYRLNGSLLSNRVNFTVGEKGYVAAAELGTLGTGGVEVDDPDADLTFNGFSTFTVDETTATPTRVWTGYIADRDLGRGRFRAAVQRTHDCTLLDLNFLLKLVVLRANDAKRPAETDIARVNWLLTSPALAGLVTDEGLVAATGGGFLPEDLRHSYALDVLTGLASAAKNYFVYRDEASGNAALFYDRDTVAVWPSSLSISSVLADVNNTTVFAPSTDAVVERSPDEAYSGIDYIYSGNPIYLASASTAAAFGFQRDLVYHTDRVGKLATAQSEAAAFLNDHAGERDVISVTIQVPSASVNYVYAGQELNLKLPHIPGYSSYTATRVRRCSKTPLADGLWEIRLELFVLGTPVADAAPPADPCAGTDDLNNLHGTVSATGTYPPANPTNTNDANDATWSEAPSGAVGSPGVAVNRYWVADLGIAYAVTSMRLVSSTATATYVDFWSSTDGAAWTARTPATDDNGTTIRNVTFASITARYWRIGDDRGTISWAYWPTIRINTWEITGCPLTETPLPFTDDPVSGDAATPVPDGTSTVFTTGDPYQANTLTVYLDGINIVADVTESDPETGAFTLGFAPENDERLSTSYRAQ